MPDFTQPGSDGELPADFKDWQWGVTYTVRPEMLAPLVTGREYRILVSVRRQVAKDVEFTAYDDLYRRAAAIATARVADVTGETAHTWIKGHAWSSKEFGAHKFLFAVLTMGLNAGGEEPAGVNPPTAEALMAPGHDPPGIFISQPIDPITIDEVYTDFDHRNPDCANPDIVLFSYGEYVPSAEGLNFEPYIARAQRLAKFHRDLIEEGPLEIVRREWMCATHPDLAVIHIYFRV